MTTPAKVRLSTTDTVYTLTPADLDTFNALVRAQGYIGPAQSSVGQTQLWNFFGVINEMAYDHFRLVNNVCFKTWMEAVLAVVMQTKTNYVVNGNSLTVTGLYVLYMYYQFNASCWQLDIDYPCEDCCKNGFPTDGYQRGGKTLTGHSKGLADAVPWNFFASAYILGWQVPGSSTDFYNSINTNCDWLNDELETQKFSTSTVALTYPGNITTFGMVQQFQQSRFDPANWTNSGDFVTAFTGCSLWQDQKTALKTLANATDMDSGSYLFILYLIMALSASNVTDQQLVQKVANTVTSSMEYANDTFMNQLVYLILIQMADPLGDFGYDNTQMKNQLNNFINAIVVSNAASAIVLKSLQNHFKILTSDASYPMQDPYNPNIGFDTRQTDTIAALDQARATMSL